MGSVDSKDIKLIDIVYGMLNYFIMCTCYTLKLAVWKAW